MGAVQQSYLPPEYWQDFQQIVVADAKRAWPNASCQIYGREGQAQDGIDVLIKPPRQSPIGIQAKKRRLYDAGGTLKVDGGLTTGQIDDYITEGEKFRPKLGELIIATTALPDTALQDHVLQVNAAREQHGKFSVQVWFWDHYQAVLNWNSDLQAIYCGDMITRTLGYQPEKHYLMLLRTAFYRLAFTTRLEIEDSGDDMVQALADTREAVVTGVLNDRKGRRIGRAPIGVDALSGSAKKHLETCVQLLDQARQRYRQAKKTGLLRSSRHGVIPYGADGKSVEREIDELRGRALAELNAALASAGLRPLENYLIAPVR